MAVEVVSELIQVGLQVSDRVVDALQLGLEQHDAAGSWVYLVVLPPGLDLTAFGMEKGQILIEKIFDRYQQFNSRTEKRKGSIGYFTFFPVYFSSA